MVRGRGRDGWLVGLGVVSAAAALAFGSPAGAEEWPQWRGPRRDGTAPGFRAPEPWPRVLEVAWRTPVGRGHASPVVAGGRVYVFSREDDREVARALDLATGEELWRDAAEAPYRASPEASDHGAGPFSTPLVHAGRLYTYGIQETLTAYEALTGRRLWRRPFDEEYLVAHPLYGTSLSPLAVDGRIVVYAGGPEEGALVALDAQTGAETWRLAGDGPPYGSPIVATLDGVRQIVTLTQRRLIGVDPASGALLWERNYPVEWDNTTSTPLVHGQALLVSSYGVGVYALRPRRRGSGWIVEQSWHTRDAAAFMSNPVLVEGVLYGFSHFNKGQLFALDADNGALLWTTRGRMAENASIVHAAPWLLVIDSAGTLSVAPASREGWRPVAEHALAESPVWAQPALAGGSLLIKDRDHLTRWRVPEAP